ncbi:MAG: hypothetical protein ACRDCY_22660 [Aeromonas veronii]
MSLLEGKMFTIEALNRIEGFVWPDGAEFASYDRWSFRIDLWSHEPELRSGGFYGQYILINRFSVESAHPDWRNSLITREEFESVDGWVRNDESMLSSSALIDIKASNGVVNSKVRYESNFKKYGNAFDIEFWRYHKPQKQEVKPDPESNAGDQPTSQEGIESLISKHKAVKEIARLARIELEQAEAAEHSLMLSIEAWAESHGFDIRVLSESDERFTLNSDLPMPENPIPLHASRLVITDWRDLRVGDVVEVREMAVVDGFIGCVGLVKRININAEHGPLLVKFDNGEEWWVKKWKFICRPEKK